MRRIEKKDNSTIRLKVSLRRQLLSKIDDPVVLETHGGFGRIWQKCYSHISSGVVFEKDPTKASVLAEQRPSWSCYECDSLYAISNSIGKHLKINFIDIDPYGDPWPIIHAFFNASYERSDILAIVVNDGLRQKLKMNGGWTVASIVNAVNKYGNSNLYKNYIDICMDMLKTKAADSGYKIDCFWGYYCGYASQMTHYAAILKSSLI